MQNYEFTKQHEKGKLHAYERILILLDEGSFKEIKIIKSEDYDGVIAGYGKISGRKVYVYAQDFSYKGGTLGEYHGYKIARIIELAIKNKLPVIGIIDSGGARIQEGINALARYGDIFYNNTKASGLIPQISVIAGPCAGGAAYSPGLTDFIFMVDKISTMFVTGPKVIKSVTNQVVTESNLGGPDIHYRISGLAHKRYATELECYNGVRDLLNKIPHYYGDFYNKNKNKNFSIPDQTLLREIVPQEPKKVYDMKNVIDIIFDKNSFLELMPEFAANIIIGFAELENITVGIVANQPCVFAGTLDCDSSNKAARFIRYCDCFNIPIITITDVPGFLPGAEQEKKGIIKHGAKLLYAYSEATTAKLNLILRKAYGGAYIAMSSKHLKADCVYAWKNAEVAVMGAEGAVEILYAKEHNALDEQSRKDFILNKINEYKLKHMNIQTAINKGYVDKILEPEYTRENILIWLKKFRNNKKNFNTKKHGNIPL